VKQKRDYEALESVGEINMYDEELLKQIGQEIDLRNKAYTERNLCVALIAQYAMWFGHTVGIRQHEGDEWEDEWRNVLFIDLPTGQVSWHLHESDLVNFPGLPPYTKEWDGHTTEEKYERVKRFIRLGKPREEEVR